MTNKNWQLSQRFALYGVIDQARHIINLYKNCDKISENISCHYSNGT